MFVMERVTITQSPAMANVKAQTFICASLETNVIVTGTTVTTSNIVMMAQMKEELVKQGSIMK